MTTDTIKQILSDSEKRAEAASPRLMMRRLCDAYRLLSKHGDELSEEHNKFCEAAWIECWLWLQNEQPCARDAALRVAAEALEGIQSMGQDDSPAATPRYERAAREALERIAEILSQ